MSSPEVRIRTNFRFDARGRIVSTREPDSTHGPLFVLARGPTSCAWAVRDDVPEEVANELVHLARLEPPTDDLHEAPRNSERYLSVLRAWVELTASGVELKSSAGPCFVFPNQIPELGDAVLIEDEALLDHHFSGWLPGEIASGRFPVMAVVVDGFPVSACCCARRSNEAAEAGLDTAERYRGRGFGTRVAAAWARAVREEGLTPLYSTSWTNDASLSVARKLRLVPYASSWKLSD